MADRKHSQRKSLSRGKKPPSANDTSSSAAAAEYLARTEGLSTTELIERDLKAMRAAGARPVECLHVSDFEDLARGGSLSPETHRHVSQCASCTALLQAMQPSSQRESEFLGLVREADKVLRLLGNAAAGR